LPGHNPEGRGDGEQDRQAGRYSAAQPETAAVGDVTGAEEILLNRA
jgi:hypothetical protein